MSFKSENIVFVLDDLERSTIPIEELLGCISDIAEQEKCKFILIGNEDKIENQDKYYEIKENYLIFRINNILTIKRKKFIILS